MPIFDGDDVYGWIYQAERYFDIHGIEEKDQIKAIAIYMEGRTVSWYHWNEERAPCHSWEGFKRKLLDRFQESQKGGIYEQFLNIQQKGTITEYISKFESLYDQLLDQSKKVLDDNIVI
ncbi:unnamed protein product [Lactuca virosa]|uniref:Retrotransposon gag domain-containing protein n=1 Tax=Lactuca virosa TaxID=75947 RepID=A0AAU9LYB3_9ASTR|nr:unnamed protein product [Lactuca virosa]